MEEVLYIRNYVPFGQGRQPGLSMDDAKDTGSELTSIRPESKADLDRVVNLPDASVLKGDIFASSVSLGAGCEISGSVCGDTQVYVGDKCRIAGGVFSNGRVEFGASTAFSILAPQVVLLAPAVLSGSIVSGSVNPGGIIPANTVIAGIVSCEGDIHVGPNCRIGKIFAGKDVILDQGVECTLIRAKGPVTCGTSCKLGQVEATSVTTTGDCSVESISANGEVLLGEGSRIGSLSAGGKVIVKNSCEIGKLRARTVLVNGTCRIRDLAAERGIAVNGQLECAVPLILCMHGRIEIKGQVLLAGKKVETSDIFGVLSRDMEELERLMRGDQPAGPWFLLPVDDSRTAGQLATTLLVPKLNAQILNAAPPAEVGGKT